MKIISLLDFYKRMILVYNQPKYSKLLIPNLNFILELVIYSNIYFRVSYHKTDEFQTRKLNPSFANLIFHNGFP